MTELNQEYAIEVEGLQKAFGDYRAVNIESLKVPKGCVFGFLGRNGAGKTTTISMLLNVIQPDEGSATVLGFDSRKKSLELKKRVGYVAQDQRLYDWMTVKQLMWFCKGFYSNWDDDLALDTMDKLDLSAYHFDKVRDLSKGNQEKLSLLLATAHKPELLILDEPTAGLDVIVRRQFLEGLVDVMHQENRTVFFSSHLVHEVERVADYIAIIRGGSIVLCDSLENIKQSIKRVVLTFDGKPKYMFADADFSVLARELSGRQEALVVRGFDDSVREWAESFGPNEIEVQDLSLEEIFIAINGK